MDTFGDIGWFSSNKAVHNIFINYLKNLKVFVSLKHALLIRNMKLWLMKTSVTSASCHVFSQGQIAITTFGAIVLLESLNSKCTVKYSSFGHTCIIFFQVQCHTYITHTCQATSNISRNLIESQWGPLRYPGQPERYDYYHIQGHQRVNTVHAQFWCL